MSLLIKALDKAQAEKAQASKDKSTKKTSAQTKSTKAAKKKSESSTAPADELTLETSGKRADAKQKEVASDDVPQALKGSAADVSQQESTESAEALTLAPAVKAEAADKTDGKPLMQAPAQAQAANVFTAKQAEPNNRTATIAIILGVLALAVMGAIAYWYQTVLNAPEPVIPAGLVVQQETPAALPEMVAEDSVSADVVNAEVVAPEMINAAEAELVPVEQPVNDEGVAEAAQSSAPATVAEAMVKVEEVPAPATQSVFTAASQVNDGRELPSIEETLMDNETVVATNVVETNQQTVGAEQASGKSSIKITPKKVETNVNPILMRAYEAYTAGNDAQAQQNYKIVLRREGPNVDAMLGLGAIAARQGRVADANDWYRKVLEVEPRNEVAKAGLLSLQQSQATAPQASESQVKSMIATTPDDANLQAALGDIYAHQNQWPAAQQAYFDAYRLGQTAENAFNLAVSLDQMGKPTLALPYYREALQKAAPSSAIDVNALQARISSIE